MAAAHVGNPQRQGIERHQPAADDPAHGDGGGEGRDAAHGGQQPAQTGELGFEWRRMALDDERGRKSMPRHSANRACVDGGDESHGDAAAAGGIGQGDRGELGRAEIQRWLEQGVAIERSRLA
jgi:hypothetical protein